MDIKFNVHIPLPQCLYSVPTWGWALIIFTLTFGCARLLRNLGAFAGDKGFLALLFTVVAVGVSVLCAMLTPFLASTAYAAAPGLIVMFAMGGVLGLWNFFGSAH